MRVRILPFGVLKDWLGASAATLELPEGATVAQLLARLSALHATPVLRGIAVSINAEYVVATAVLHDGDEVGLLPPVSGGAPDQPPPVADAAIHTQLTREPIDTAALAAAARRGKDGAIIVFDGMVRDNTRGRKTLYLDYEAYEEMAARQIAQLAREALGRFGVRHVTLVHRLGRLNVGETSVLIVVASAHRAQAYEASRWLIDTLKSTVPIWKKETFEDGAVWAAGEPFPAGVAVEEEAADAQ